MQGGGTETGVLLLVVFVLFLSGQQTLPLQPRPGNTQDKKIFDKEGGFGTLVCASFCVLLLMESITTELFSEQLLVAFTQTYKIHIVQAHMHASLHLIKIAS